MQYEESIYGDKVIIIPFDRAPVLDTEDDWITVWSIFSETKYPEEAVKVQMQNMIREKLNDL